MEAGARSVIDLSRYDFEALWKDEELILYRGRSKSDASRAAFASRLRQATARPYGPTVEEGEDRGRDAGSAEPGCGAPSDLDQANFIQEPRQSPSDAGRSRVLVLSSVAEYPAPECLKRLEHEYSLREELDPTWAARPIAITRHWDRTVLVLEDPGGVPLEQLLSQHLDSAFSLRLAIGLSTAIGRLHQRGLIHKDIKPANILVNSVTGQCWLRGFGIASRLPRERPGSRASRLCRRHTRVHGARTDWTDESFYRLSQRSLHARRHAL